MLVYTPRITPRVIYCFNLILKDVLGITIKITDNTDEYCNHSGAKICYSRDYTDDGFFIKSSGLLEETGINNKLQIPFSEFLSPESSFDLFTASFYLVTRYEEYLSNAKDEHGRFAAENSVAYRNGFLTKPVINIRAEHLLSQLLKKFPGLKYEKRSYKFVSTIDVDTAFAFKSKGILRTAGGIAKDLLRFDFNRIIQRIKTVAGTARDPFDTYQIIKNMQTEYGYEQVMFFHIGDYGRYDGSIDYSNELYRSLIRNIGLDLPDRQADLKSMLHIGLHPSYYSYSSAKKITIERNRLEEITGNRVTKSRMHFLRMNIPETYINLIAAGITDDYTMGYASHLGFRAGICTPFRFYDLRSESETTLTVHPFCVMDGTLKEYMKVNPSEAMSYITPLINTIKENGGEFISVWHNHSLSEQGEWEGWGEVYNQLVKNAMKPPVW